MQIHRVDKHRLVDHATSCIVAIHNCKEPQPNLRSNMSRPIRLVIILSLCHNAVHASSVAWNAEKARTFYSVRYDFDDDIEGRNSGGEYTSGDGNDIVSPTPIPRIIEWDKAIHAATDKRFRSLLQMIYTMKRHGAGIVQISLKFCMNTIVSSTLMMDFMSVARELSLCIGKVYLPLKINYVVFARKPWDDLIDEKEDKSTNSGMYFLSKISDEPMDDASNNAQNGCQLDYGSISRMPSIGSCIMESVNTTNNTLQRYIAPSEGRCDAQSHVVFAINATFLCFESPHTTVIAYFKSAWMLAKVNYGLILLTTLCVITPTLHNRIVQHQRYKSRSGFVFGVLNLFWMIWRLQETLHWDTQWQQNIPYICVVTNTLRYIVEGMAMFLFAWTSLERYQAIAGPLIANPSERKNKLTLTVGIIGILAGGICSVLHIVALFTITGTPTLLETCSIPTSASGNLTLLIVAKVISLAAIYLVPCIVMSAANIAMSRSVKRKAKQELGRCYSKKQTRSKTTRILNFLVFSSLFMVFCVSKPIFEVYVAVKIHVGASAWGRDVSIGVLLDSITWNLTVIAFTINTVLGLLYTK